MIVVMDSRDGCLHSSIVRGPSLLHAAPAPAILFLFWLFLFLFLFSNQCQCTHSHCIVCECEFFGIGIGCLDLDSFNFKRPTPHPLIKQGIENIFDFDVPVLHLERGVGFASRFKLNLNPHIFGTTPTISLLSVWSVVSDHLNLTATASLEFECRADAEKDRGDDDEQELRSSART